MKSVHGIRSLRRKLFLVIMLSTLTALLATGGVMAYYDLRSYRQIWTSDLRTQAEFLGGATTAALQFNDPATAADALANLRFRPRILAAAIFDVHGGVFASYQRDGEASAIPDLPGDAGVRSDGETLFTFQRIVANDEILGTAYVLARYELHDRLRDYFAIIGVVSAASLLLALLITLWLQTFITRPVLSIARVARRVVDEDNYSLRAQKISDDEVGVLADSFNKMLSVIDQRTEDLEQSNRRLEHEIAERARAENEIHELNTDLERRVQERTAQLNVTNQELEAFCYSVSHDLRGPLRAIDGFSEALIEELPAEMPGESQRYLDRIRAATVRMGQLIDDLLNLSRVSRSELNARTVDLTRLCEEVIDSLSQGQRGRRVDVSIWEGMTVEADERLLRTAMENLLGNAWKFTQHIERPCIEVGVLREPERSVYFVRDNGPGFDMAYADKIFGAFQRLHAVTEFPGTGIGLATVQRIIHRHGGRIWADARVGKGAVFHFTLAPEPDSQSGEAHCIHE